MASEADVIAHLAAAVADGDAVDWNAAEDSAQGDEALAVRQLRVVAEIAALYRSAVADDTGSGEAITSADTRAATDGAPTPVPPPEGLFDWGGLRVLERVGEGSFGEVYRAWDLSLHREVALKLLRRPSGQGVGAGSAAFREAQLLARIHDPHVMAIYGVRNIDARVGIWGEFLRGRTLAQIIKTDGPLSAGEAAGIGEALCHALTTVHRAGILHRDIKAQNVIRATGGRFVLTDFGLGIVAASQEAADGQSMAGTPLYMAPELFEGARPSVRSDVYSLGALLFYAVTGSFPVTGRSLDEVRAAHAGHARKHLHEVRPDLPTTFVDAIERALEPVPERRLESAAALRSRLTGAPRPDVVAPHASRRRQVALALASLGAVGLLAALAWRARPGARPAEGRSPVLSFVIPPPARLSFAEGSRNVAAVSPDGTRIAFVGTDPSGETRIYIRAMSSLTSQPVEGSSGAANPFWSPDGQSLAFVAKSRLKRIPAAGGVATVLATSPEERGGAWNADGTILFAPDSHSGILRVPVTGGAPQALTAPALERGEMGHGWPRLIGESRWFCYFVMSGDPAVSGIYIRSLDGGPARRLVATSASAGFAQGHLLYLQDDTLLAQRLALDTGELTGEPFVVARGVATTWTAQGAFSVSQNGVLVYTVSRTKDSRQLTWYDLTGRRLGTFDAPGLFRNPVLAPGGQAVAVQWYEGGVSQIRIYNLARGGWSRLGEPQANAEFPTWSPDGQRIAFTSQRRGPFDLYVQEVNSTAASRLLWSSPTDKMPTDWSPDGRWISVAEKTARGDYDLVLAAAGGDGEVCPLADTEAVQETMATFSPDGRFVAYASNRSSRFEVYVERFPTSGLRRPASTEGGYDPRWAAPDRLIYMNPRGQLLEVYVPAEERADISRATPFLTTGVSTPGSSRNHYTIDRRGRRLLLSEPVVDPVYGGLNVLVNWVEGSRTTSASPR
jgi:Tol biopolymer transport system component